MFLLLRLVAVLTAVLWKAFPRFFEVQDCGHVKGRAIVQRVLRDKKQRVFRFEVGASLPSSQRFSFTLEGHADRWVKSMGLVQELQTGDPAFDDRVYVACGHEAMHALLRSSSVLRSRILAVFDGGFERIEGDGSRVWLSIDGDEPFTNPRELAADLAGELEQLDHKATWTSDPYWRRIIAVELMLAAVIGYAAGAIVRYPGPTVYPRWSSLVSMSAACAFGLSALCGGVVWLLLRGSSRAHRSLMEAAVTLLVALPAAGYVLACDLNERPDPKDHSVIMKITDAWDQRFRGGRRAYTLRLDGWVDGKGPVELDVSRDTYQASSVGKPAMVAVGAGALGVPYVRGLEPQ